MGYQDKPGYGAQQNVRGIGYVDSQGVKLIPTFTEINSLVSGISSGVSAGMLNLLSGLTASAATLNSASTGTFELLAHLGG